MDEKKQQELMFKLQMYEQQMQNMQQQIGAIEEAKIDLEKLEVDLEEFSGKRESEVLAPLGRGIFVKTKLLSEEFLVDIGGGNLVKKTIPETKKVLEEQIKKLNGLKEELQEALENLHKELETMFLDAQKEQEQSQ